MNTNEKMSSELIHYRVYDGNRVKEDISEKMIVVSHDLPPLPPGFKLVYTWGPVLEDLLKDKLYPAIGRKENIRPATMLVREYTVLSREPHKNYVLDRYIRVGDGYLCKRSYSTTDSVQEYMFPMRLTEEQKESIAAGAMHPSRLKKWLEKGWETEWDKYF